MNLPETSCGLPRETVERMEEVLGITRLRAVEFRIAVDEVPTAKVEFVMSVEQYSQLVEMMMEGCWTSRNAVL